MYDRWIYPRNGFRSREDNKCEVKGMAKETKKPKNTEAAAEKAAEPKKKRERTNIDINPFWEI